MFRGKKSTAEDVHEVALNANMTHLEASVYLGIVDAGFAMDQGEAADAARSIAAFIVSNMPQEEEAHPDAQAVTPMELDRLRTEQLLWRSAMYFHECGFAAQSIVDALRNVATQMEASHLQQGGSSGTH